MVVKSGVVARMVGHNLLLLLFVDQFPSQQKKPSLSLSQQRILRDFGMASFDFQTRVPRNATGDLFTMARHEEHQLPKRSVQPSRYLSRWFSANIPWIHQWKGAKSTVPSKRQSKPYLFLGWLPFFFEKRSTLLVSKSANQLSYTGCDTLSVWQQALRKTS